MKETMTRKQGITKKVDGVDLSASSFAYVGDPDNRETWIFPIHFPGSELKTANHIKNALHRFDETKGIPDGERGSLRLILFGAAKSHGIPVERRQFKNRRIVRRTQCLQKRIQNEIAEEMEREKHQKQTAALMMGAPKPL